MTKLLAKIYDYALKERSRAVSLTIVLIFLGAMAINEYCYREPQTTERKQSIQ